MGKDGGLRMARFKGLWGVGFFGSSGLKLRGVGLRLK